ncbi:PP0621 family protein [Rhodoferax sp.]|uniref:PP0621 family protein n=1 Tax=Rhodoferax sp. TaxID=50421 RepID=UPI0025F7C4F1|nr:PP0621 family protein [Rhodoferax sp.]
MKLLIVLLAVLLGVWLWRSRRVQDKRPTTAPPKVLQNMVPCQVCGVLLPQNEAVTTPHGVYCGPAHRKQAEQAPR